MDARCHEPSVHLDNLNEPRRRLWRQGSRRHNCHVLQRACLWRRQVLTEAALPAGLARMRVRMVHVGFDIQRVDSLGIFLQRSASSLPEAPVNFSRCVPLMWWPLWGYNIGEFFQSSVLPIAELQAAGVIGRDVMLAPEVGGWPLRDYHVDMLSAFTRHAVKTTGRLAPKCPAASSGQSSRCPPPQCFEQMLVCKFRDVYDREVPVAPWTAARDIVAAMRRPVMGPAAAVRAADAAAWRTFGVLFTRRAAAKNGARALSNEAELLQFCAKWSPPESCVGPGVTTRCEVRRFGVHGFRRDVEAVQAADVLVGTHGAALVHAIFMRRGSALIEVRPYGFKGAWPDQYHLAMARAENAVRACLNIDSTSPPHGTALC